MNRSSESHETPQDGGDHPAAERVATPAPDANPSPSAFEFDCRKRFPSGFQLDLSFATPGLVTGIFGPSGSGKTTVLNVLAGFTRPDEGLVRLGERPVFDSRRRINLPPERRRVGFVFQDQLLFPHMSVAANLRYGRARGLRAPRLGAAPKAVADLFERVVAALELGQLLDRYPRNLSGGERQRVALGRALASEPEFLLLDEPLAALDPKLKAQVLEHLAAVIEARRLPTLMVSHDARELCRICQWVLLMGGGRLVAQGPAETVLAGGQ